MMGMGKLVTFQSRGFRMNRPCACKKVGRIIYKVYDHTDLWKIIFFFQMLLLSFFKALHNVRETHLARSASGIVSRIGNCVA